jgi:diguanylate cyclase (GGDEF)-like protein/PAS domain S-box-containing protein
MITMTESRGGADNRLGADPRGDTVPSGLPKWFVWTVGVVCLLPLFLHVLGLDAGLDLQGQAGGPHEPAVFADAMPGALAGSLVHVLLEWSAFCAAVVTVVLAFVHYRSTGNITMPVMGMAILCAGCMDAFHGLAAVGLLGGEGEPDSLIAFTWALSRTYGAIVLVSGVALLLLRRRERLENHWLLLAAAVAIALVSYLAIKVCVAHTVLPRTIFPDSLIRRPYEIVPLLLFAVAGIPLLAVFHRRHRSLFSHALLISLMPAIAMELYTAFGSAALFDACFNVAHGLKIVTYVVPLAGLVMDYECSYRQRTSAAGALRRSEERFEVAVRGTSDGLWDWDPQTNEIWYASRFKELLGYRENEFPNVLESFNSHLHPDDYNRTWRAINGHLERGEPFDTEFRMRTRSGDYRWFRARASAVHDDEGQPIRMAGSIQDITDRKEAIEQLERISTQLAQANTEIAVDARIDPLTRVLNRGAWEEAITIEDERSRRHGHAYAVMIVDIDHFKQFNDAAGHLAGDDCLRAIADCICRTCRLTDVVGRYGGEEFVVLLAETDLPSGQRAAERVLETIRGRGIRHEGLGPDACVTASAGVAEGPLPDGWKPVLDEADKALYRAKSNGRDRVEITEAREAA